MTRRHARVGTVVAAMLMLLVVGLGSSGADRVESAFKQRLEAAVAGDHHRFCELTSAEQRRELTGQGAGLSECVDATRRQAGERTISDRQRDAVERVEVVDVRIDGDRADAYLRLDGCTDWGSSFRRVSMGRWQFDGSLPIGKVPSCVRELRR